jgi:hypothetical protein
MLEKIANLPPGIVGIKAFETVSKDEYEKVMEPLFDEARKAGEKLRFLYEFAPDFRGFSAGAALEDARFGLGAVGTLAGCAVVADTAWVREASKFVGFWLPFPVRVFALAERERALEFLRTLPGEPGISRRVLPEAGVIVVEIQAALGPRDFDALAGTVDAWIDAQGSLNGLVLRAPYFPGWESLQGIVKHVRFVRDHHRKIKRVALVTNAKLATLAPELADHFIEAEVRQFGYSHLDEAIAWARGDGSAP